MRLVLHRRRHSIIAALINLPYARMSIIDGSSKDPPSVWQRGASISHKFGNLPLAFSRKNITHNRYAEIQNRTLTCDGISVGCGILPEDLEIKLRKRQIKGVTSHRNRIGESTKTKTSERTIDNTANVTTSVPSLEPTEHDSFCGGPAPFRSYSWGSVSER